MVILISSLLLHLRLHVWFQGVCMSYRKIYSSNIPARLTIQNMQFLIVEYKLTQQAPIIIDFFYAEL